MNKRLLLLAIVMGVLAACGLEGSSMRGTTQRCTGSENAYTCNGSINQIVGEPTVSMGSGSVRFSELSVSLLVTVEEGEVLVTFTDEDGGTVEALASPGSPAELSGDPMTFDGEMTMTLQAQGEERTASGITYQAEFTR